MNASEIRAIFQDELGRIAPEVDFDALDPAADLREQADIDSMDFLNLVTALHVRLKIDIPEADYPKLATLQAAMAYLEQHTAR
jgi:acyl carrier protein